MIPPQLESLESPQAEYHKHYQCDYFLNDLELQNGEWTAIAFKTHTVGRHLETVFEQGYTPGEQYHGIERPGGGDTGRVELQMAVPGEGHKHVGNYEKAEGDQSCRHCYGFYIAYSGAS